MALRNRFSAPVKQAVYNNEASLTKQSFAADADINNIVGAHLKKRQPGVQPMPIGNPAATRRITYGFQPALDYHQALNTVVSARIKFDSLPAKVRTRFANDVGAMLDFAANPENRAEALEYGLVVPTDEEAAAKTKAELEIATVNTVNMLREALYGAPGGSTEAGNPTKADDEAQPKYNTPQKGGK